MSQGPQKPDHRGSFIVIPRMLFASAAWFSTSARARAVLLAFHAKHNGFNNGQIAVGIRELSLALGDQNHGATSRAVAELIEKGFLECTTDADHRQSKVREYRLTYISTGREKKVKPATNEYLDWRPQPGTSRKFGGARTATQKPVCVTDTATNGKFPVTETATSVTENRGVLQTAHVAVTASLLNNHSPQSFSVSEISPKGPKNTAGAVSEVDDNELRDWTKAAIQQLGYGGARRLAEDAGVPEPVLSRFRHGKSLPNGYRTSLQMGCGRALSYRKWKDATSVLAKLLDDQPIMFVRAASRTEEP